MKYDVVWVDSHGCALIYKISRFAKLKTFKKWFELSFKLCQYYRIILQI